MCAARVAVDPAPTNRTRKIFNHPKQGICSPVVIREILQRNIYTKLTCGSGGIEGESETKERFFVVDIYDEFLWPRFFLPTRRGFYEHLWYGLF